MTLVAPASRAHTRQYQARVEGETLADRRVLRFRFV